ncbi:MAG: ATP-binding protein [Solirubrobacteraceae bacterium]
MLSDDDIFRYNPWWIHEGWESDDLHLRRLRARATQLPSPQVEQVDLERPAVHILRGPRQVGKSTDLKLLVRRARRAGVASRRIVYLSLDLLEDRPAAVLVATVGRALELAGVEAVPPRLILLDEVTATQGWRTAIKVLWDDGRIDRDIVVCTGSSAIDLAQAPERLPGRRGAGRDMLVLPSDFATFARTVDARVPPGLGLTVAEMLTDDGRVALADAQVHLPALRTMLDRYLLFGGLPAAVAEAAAGLSQPSEEVQGVLWDSLVREVQRRGASISAAQALLERIARSLGAKLSWSRLARELAVPLGAAARRGRSGSNDPRTVQSYVEMLAINYFALILYFWKADSGSGDLAKDKKVYFGDPLLQTITAARAGLSRNPHADVENALALALYRRYEPPERSAEGFPAPERLHVWGTRRGGEIDFVCGARPTVEAVAVADWDRISRQKATAPMRALPGRPSLVVTRNELAFTPTANLIPAPLALWALSD